MTGTDVRETLTEIGDAVIAPAPDRLAFQAEVRRARRRRTTGRVLAAGAVAACVGAVAGLAGGVLPDGSPSPAPATAPGVSQAAATDPVYVVRDGELTAFYGAERVPLGVRAEGILGSTQQRVYAVSDTSRIEVLVRVTDPEGSTPAEFRTAPAPYDGAVDSAALSADGRYLAWLVPGGRITVADLETDEVAYRLDAAPNSYVADVDGAGVLVSEDGDLVLRNAQGSVPVPTEDDGYGWASQVVGDRVLVNDRDDTARIYDVVGGEAVPRAELPGSGTLSPDGDSVALVERRSDDTTVLRLWDGRETRTFEGVVGTADGVRWVADGSPAGLVLAHGHEEGQPRLWACLPLQLQCGQHPASGTDLYVGE